MAYVKFNKTSTLAQAKASTNPNKIFFPTDSKKIVTNGKEYGGEDGVDPIEVKSMNAIVPNGVTDGLAALTRLRGNTIKWNQKTKLSDWNSSNTHNVTLNNGVFTVNTTGADTYFLFNAEPPIVNHKYYLSVICTVPSGITTKYGFPNSYSNVKTLVNGKNSWLITNTSDGLVLDDTEASSYTGTTFKDFMLIDLTEIFGEGNEPTSVEEAEAYLAQLGNVNLPYSEGTITPVKMTGIKSVGFNLFDESTLILGKYRQPNGSEQTTENRRCSYVYFPCIPNTDYYLGYGGSIEESYGVVICWYDSNKNFISGTYRGSIPNYVHHSPSNAAYFRISSASPSGNININISDPSRNGTYKPYNGGTTNFNVTQLRGKLNGVGSLVYPFDNGMNGFNGIYDEVLSLGNVKIGVKRFSRVDLGSLTWVNINTTSSYRFEALVSGAKRAATTTSTANIICAKYIATTPNSTWLGDEVGIVISNSENKILVYDTDYTDATTFKAAMQGVMLYYELATPEYYILEEPDGILPNIPVEEGGVISVLPDNTDEIITAAPLMDIRWRAVAADVAKSVLYATTAGAVAWDNITGKPSLDLDREVIAEALLQLRADMDGLKKRLDEAPKWVDTDYGYTIKGQKMFDLTSGAPDYVPLSKGLIRMDASTGHVWVSTAVTNSTSDWKQIA